MKVILHAGAHATDEGKLLRCLLRNADDLRGDGVAIPGPGRYRKILSGSLHALQDAEPAEDARDILLESILDDDPKNINRLIMSHEHLFSVPKMAVSYGQIYPKADQRMVTLNRLLREDRLELFMAVRNPATWLPAVFADTPHEDFLSFLDGSDPAYLRWSDLIERIHAFLPGLPITVWCNEDSPLIWGEIIRAMAGLKSGTKITGAFDLLARIMSVEGMQRFRDYLKSHPVMPEKQKRRVMMAFLDKFALEDEIEQELDVPGWTEDYIDTLCELYERDVGVIANMDNVSVISP